MKKNLVLFFLLTPFLVFSQLTENFDDGDFTNNPIWSGTTVDFIINSNQQLQTNSNVAATSYLFTLNLLSNLDDVEWSFYFRQSFAGSGSNYSRIYLTADDADLNNVQNGYYLLFGEAGSNDAIRLFKLESGTATEILAGTAGAIATSFAVGVRILHTATGDWQLYADYAGGSNFVLEATANDANSVAEPYFGIGCVYTVSNIKKIYFDDLYIGDVWVDQTPPSLGSVDVIDDKNIQVNFSEAIDATIVNEAITVAPSLLVDNISVVSPTSIQMAFSSSFINGQSYEVTIPHVMDLVGNDTTISFTFMYLIAENPMEGDVIISEFMSDPSPVIGLPDAEYVEVYNKSNKIFNVKDWKIINNSDAAGKLKETWLLPGEYLVITSTTNEALFTKSIGATSFPSLKNAGDDIILTDENGNVLDRLTYTLDWFDDPAKKDGGYSLERLKLNVNCSDKNNWKASVDEMGGTPGEENSVNDATPDVTAPSIDNLFITSDSTLTILFSEPLGASWSTVTEFLIEPNVPIAFVEQDSLEYAQVHLAFSQALEESKEYYLAILNVEDCQGNFADSLGIYFTTPSIPEAGDLVFNELLFNPLTGGADFIELKNVASKVFNLKGLQLTNTKTGNSNNTTILVDYMVYPNELVVLTPDTTFQKERYPFHGNGNFIQMTIPSMANKEETVVLFMDSLVLDSLHYNEKWHFKLLGDVKGKSLEKISGTAASELASSWHTASESVSFATPGVDNSQNAEFLYNGTLSLNSETFSPDNDGFEDILIMTYEMEDIGYVGSVTIYDDRGRLIRKLVGNELLGIRGEFAWDGLNEQEQKAHVGTYVVVFDGYHVDSGKTFKLKKVAVLAGDL